MTDAEADAGDADTGDAHTVPRPPHPYDPSRTHRAYARLMLETMPEESRIGLTLGFVRTFGIPGIARVLAGTGRMESAPKARAKATGVAMFALIGSGVDTDEGRRVVAGLRRIHERPDITPELMRYVMACFTVCPLRFIDAHGHRAVTDEEREGAYAFHTGLLDALGLPRSPDEAQLADVERWMRAYEARHFAPTPQGRALWTATSGGLLAARLPRALARLAPAVAASLLDPPLRAALDVRPPLAPVRGLVAYGLRMWSGARARSDA
ncbi:oxygenase MpaB family protein [Streptomyces sp. NPDC093109]|uniref:oxygenase MpaB family protein n=1 Tax=Streptomyces sp. NPDC093109 TaxID=3154977 RepID=UPI00344E5806